MSVFIENELDTDIPDNFETIIPEIVDAVVEFLNCPYVCEVNVIFTDDEGIHSMNKEFRGIDRPTDVLSFPLVGFVPPANFECLEEDNAQFFNNDTGELMLGDIVLNVNRIASQAEEYGHSTRRESAFLTAHSMLHLFGYDHIEDDERIEMERLQDEILNTKGYTRND